MKTLKQLPRKLFTQTEYAKHRGHKTRSSVGRKIKQHGIPLHDGKVDPVEADAILDAAANRSGRGRKLSNGGKRTPGPKASNTPKPGTYGEAQARREHFKALLAEQEYRQRTGELVEVAAVEKAAFETARRVRDAVLNVPHRVAGVLAAETDQHKVHTLLTAELHQALEGLAT